MTAQNQRGFTLIEVLLATAILSVIIALVYTSFDQTANLSAHVDRVSGHYREARLVLSKMSDELQSTYYYKDDGETFFVGVDGLDGDGMETDRLEFTSMSRGFIGDAPGSYHHGVTYHVMQHNGHNRLMYTETLNPLGSGPSNRQSYPLIDDLAGFQVRYLEKKGVEWRDGWDKKSLPQAVQVTLLFERTGEQDESQNKRDDLLLPLSTVIRVPMGGV